MLQRHASRRYNRFNRGTRFNRGILTHRIIPSGSFINWTLLISIAYWWSWIDGRHFSTLSTAVCGLATAPAPLNSPACPPDSSTEANAEIARFMAPPHLNVNPYVGCEVVFAKIGTNEHEPVVPTLQYLSHVIANVVDLFDPFFT